MKLLRVLSIPCPSWRWSPPRAFLRRPPLPATDCAGPPVAAGYVVKDLGTFGRPRRPPPSPSPQPARPPAGRRTPRATNTRSAGMPPARSTTSKPSADSPPKPSRSTTSARSSERPTRPTAAGTRSGGPPPGACRISAASAEQIPTPLTSTVLGRSPAPRTLAGRHGACVPVAAGHRDPRPGHARQRRRELRGLRDQRLGPGRRTLGPRGRIPWAMFRWDPSTGMTNIFASLTEPVEFEYVVIADINEAGQVAGVIGGYNPDGIEGEYVVAWDPTAEYCRCRSASSRTASMATRPT